jgi:FkbM family methyltransferase
MELIKDLKELYRSGSFDFVKARRPASHHNPSRILAFQWKGNEIFYRSGTSDRGLIYEVLVRPPSKAEYFVSPEICPGIIFDVGANIGIVSLWLSEKYPDAEIHAFEPVPGNVSLLRKNTAHKNNIVVHPYGLSNENKRAKVYTNSDINNLGGFSEHARGNDPQNAGNFNLADFEIEIRDVRDVIEELGVERIDLIKIDTEGGEFEIVSSIPDRILSNVYWVMGELHGRSTFETLSHLDRWMSVGAIKRIGSEVFTFQALNRGLLKSQKYEV